MRGISRQLSVLLIAVLFVLSGCLPTSCQREEPTALFPADSLSREIAESMPSDSISLIHATRGPEETPLSFPRTIQFGSDGTIYATDAERNQIYTFNQDGTFDRILEIDGLDIPFLADIRDDTLVVHNAGASRIDIISGEERVRSVSLPQDNTPRDALTYATATDSAAYLKVASEQAGVYIERLNNDGTPTGRASLPGPHWRHAGLLRLWEDRLVSLSGFRPLVDTLPVGFSDGAEADSVHLLGFNSPMLARSRGFTVGGDVSEPPLLSPSATTAGQKLFVLNTRPGWLHIDVFDQQGTLHYRLEEANPELDTDHYPRDLAVYRHPEGYYLLAILLSDPEPALELHRWIPRRGDLASLP